MRNQIQKLLDSDLEQFTYIKTNRSATKHNTQNEKNERSLDNMSLKTLNYFINLPMVYLVMKIKKNN